MSAALSFARNQEERPVQKQKWNPVKAAAIGAVVSPLALAAQMLMGNTGASGPSGGGAENLANYIGLVAGGMIGGALLFGLVAVLRNSLIK